MRTKAEAINAAKALKARMKSGRWRRRLRHLFFNWKVCIETGPPEATLRVAFVGHGKYLASLGNSDRVPWSQSLDHSDPQQAVIEQLAVAQRTVDRYQSWIDKAAKAAGIEPGAFKDKAPLNPTVTGKS